MSYRELHHYLAAIQRLRVRERWSHYPLTDRTLNAPTDFFVPVFRP